MGDVDMPRRNSILLMIICILTLCPCGVLAAKDSNYPQNSSFALPTHCEVGGVSANLNCLADILKPGIYATMLRQDGLANCVAQTAGPYKIDDGAHDFEATLLTHKEKCTDSYRIAFLSKKNTPVKLRNIKTTTGILSSKFDRVARQLLSKKQPESDGCKYTSETVQKTPNIHPVILTTGKYSLYVYSSEIYPSKDNNRRGQSVLFYNNKPFVLKGPCTEDHVFFTVNGRLHLTYVLNGCNSGAYTIYVYDLSTSHPVLVYINDVLGV
ncbi:MAG: hypothetical protein NTW42_01195 [Deltaproteobacteria bacterium]|nr:hypothetical protein [Deltaproteobacteria bacterium]